MKITEIMINRFSGLHDFHLDLQSGINIIYGENESGKSTVSAFIKYIFYGFADKSARLHAMGWGEDSVSGYLILEFNGNKYRINRETAASGRETLQTLDLSTGDSLDNITEPGAFFFGIPSGVFDSTVFVRQLSGSGIDGTGIAQSIENILCAADEKINTAKALKRLDELRVALLHRNRKGGLIFETEQKAAELEGKLAEAEMRDKDIQEKSTTLENLKNNLAKNTELQKKCRNELELYKSGQLLRTFNQAKGYKTELEDVRAAKAEVAARCERLKLTPSRDILTELKALNSDYEHINTLVASLNLKISELNAECQDLTSRKAMSDMLTRDGGSDAVMLDFQKHNKRFRLFVTASIISLALTVPTFFLNPIIAAIPAIVGVILMIVSRVFSSYTKQLCAAYGASGERTLRSTLEHIEIDSEKVNGIAAELSDNEQRFNDASLKKTDLYSKIEEYLTLTSSESLEALITAVEDILTESERLDASEEKYSELFENTYAPLREYTKFDLEAHLKNAPTDEWFNSFNYAEVKKNSLTLTDIIDTTKDRIHTLEKELVALSAGKDSTELLLDEKQKLKAKYSRLLEKYKAVILAADTITSAAAKLKNSIAPRIAENAGKLLSSLSSGKYSLLGINQSYELEYGAGNSALLRDSSYFSAGTSDIAYISLRLSLSSLIGEGKLPVIFDESFVRLDEGRLTNMLSLLHSSDIEQILLFTSHTRENQILSQLGTCSLVKI